MANWKSKRMFSFKGKKEQNFALPPLPTRGKHRNLIQNFLLKHYDFLHRGLFCSRPMKHENKSNAFYLKQFATHHFSQNINYLTYLWFPSTVRV